MTHLFRRIVGPVVSILIFGIAAFALRRALHSVHLAQVREAMLGIPTSRFLAAVACTLIVYVILSFYDYLAFHHFRFELHLKKILFTSFIGNTLGLTLGFALLTGGSLRYRLYSDWGFDLSHVAKVTAFGVTTFTLSLLFTSGIALLADAPLFATIFPFPVAGLRILGLGLLAPVAMYLFWSTLYPDGVVGFRSWSFRIPPLRVSLGQLALTALEVSFTAAILYALLPPSDLSLHAFLGLYVFSQLLGFASQVPSGLGVFDASMLVLLERFYSTETALGALLMFRVLFYVIPLVIALIMLGGYEIHRYRKGARSPVQT